MTKNTRSKWMVVAEDKLPSASEIDMPPSSIDAKPLSELLESRPERPIVPSTPPMGSAPAMPPAPALAPAPKPAVPPTPLTDKEVSDNLEQAAKALLDSALGAERAKTAVAKLSAMGSNTDKDRSVVSKSERLVVQIEKVKGALDMLAKEVGDYRNEVSKPESSSSWLA
jgi:hypothetical protein